MTSGSPAITVITPTLDRLPHLRQAMDSVAAQTLQDWEHIVVDDGSRDGTEAEVRRRAVLDPRVRYLRREQEKAGANVCRNLGIARSTSKLVLFLDSDDVLDPRCLEMRTDAMARHPAIDFAVFPGWVFTDTPGDLRQLFGRGAGGDDLDRFLFLEYPWEITGPVWRKAALEKLGGFAEDLPSWQDVDLHVRALLAGLRYVKTDEPDHHVRWKAVPDRTSTKQFASPHHLRSGEKLVRAFHARLTERDALTPVRGRAVAGLFFLLAERWMRLGERRTARRTWLAARQLGLNSTRVAAAGWLVLRIFSLRLLPADYNDRLLERFRVAAGYRLRTP